jgi:hypothetical protein
MPTAQKTVESNIISWYIIIYLDTDGKTILKWILSKQYARVQAMIWIEFDSDSCDHNYELMGLVKGGEFLDQLNDCQETVRSRVCLGTGT